MKLAVKLRYFIVAICLLSVSGCGSNDKNVLEVLECRIVYIDTLGVYDGDSTNSFMSISDIDFDQAGNLYIVDMLAGRVVKFDPQLQFESTIGRPGNGPGEFCVPTSIVLRNNGYFLVADPRIRVVHAFGQDGIFLNSLELPENALVMYMESASEDLFIAYTQTHRQENNILYSGHSVLLLNSEGCLLNELYSREKVHSEDGSTNIAFAADSRNERVFLCHRGVEASYVITCLSLSGDTLYQIEEDYEPCPKTTEELAAQGLLLSISPHPDSSSVSSFVYVPDNYRPPVHGLFVSGHGNLWVNSGYGDEASPLFCIYNGETGALIGRLQTDLPVGARQWQYKELAGIWYGYSLNPEDYPKVIVFSFPETENSFQR